MSTMKTTAYTILIQEHKLLPQLAYLRVKKAQKVSSKLVYMIVRSTQFQQRALVSLDFRPPRYLLFANGVSTRIRMRPSVEIKYHKNAVPSVLEWYAEANPSVSNPSIRWYIQLLVSVITFSQPISSYFSARDKYFVSSEPPSYSMSYCLLKYGSFHKRFLRVDHEQPDTIVKSEQLS